MNDTVVANLLAKRLRRHELLSKLRAHRDTLRDRFGIQRVALFGPAARDQLPAGRAVEMLVEFGKEPTLRAYFDAEYFLEEIVGGGVDMVTRKGLAPNRIARIENELVHV